MLLAISAVTSFISSNASAQSYFQSEFASVWKRSTEYTLEVANAMPEDKYHYQPSEKSMTFQKQMIHIAQNLTFLSSKITGNKPDFLEGNREEQLRKEEVIQVVQKALIHVHELILKTDSKTLQEKIEFKGDTLSKENIFYLMRDHMAHHRGQAILYLRLNDIEVPGYKGW